MRRSFFALPAFALVGVTLAGCTQTERGRLLLSSGPQVESAKVDDYVVVMNNMRRLYYEMAGEEQAATQASVDPTAVLKFPPIKGEAKLTQARDLLFAYVDSRCDAYLDAIFWASRARSGFNRSNNAVGATASAVLAATGAAPNVLGIVATAFGLSGELFDTGFESVLYGLEPSSIRYLVDQANVVVRNGYDDENVKSEPALLQQVQDYIRQCTPANLDFLVNQALKNANLVPVKTEFKANLFSSLNCQLKLDGTVIAKSGTVYPLGQDFKGENCGFALKPNGIVTIGGDDKDFSDLAKWTEIPKPKDAGKKSVSPADGGGDGSGAKPSLKTVRVGVE